ncbi:MAG TPA: sulfatase-like hydrolase/transferase [Phycisphaerae bacterium]|nr:sulfatase-like hydrolase/transferase [Phycisphaerae bacterium]
MMEPRRCDFVVLGRTFNRRCLVWGVLAMGLAGWGGAQPARAIESRRLNVLLIVSDDKRHDTMSCAGHPIVRTPHTDRLAERGVRFTHAFASLPICTPSRAAFLTGRFEPSNGVRFFGQRIHENIVAWPKAMARAGYQTAFTGKWHNVRHADEYGFEWTANIFLRGMDYRLDPPLAQKPGGPEKIVQGEVDTLTTDAAVRFLGERDCNRPFFLYVAYTAPHDPRDPLPEFARMYDANRMPLPPNFLPQPKFDPGTLGIRDEKLLPLPRPELDLKREIAHYYGLITQMDEQIGRLLKAMEQGDLTRNTIVIFASDNGLALGAHGLLGKQTMYEEGVRVPLIMVHPDLTRRAGRTSDALVYLLDMMPTVCEWTGVSMPDGVEGRSLAPVYAGRISKVRDSVIGRYDEGDDPRFRMIRTDRHKLIRYLNLGREELFDLRADPHETKDLAGDPQMQETRKSLRDRLHRILVEQRDEIGLAALKD